MTLDFLRGWKKSLIAEIMDIQQFITFSPVHNFSEYSFKKYIKEKIIFLRVVGNQYLSW